jgi:small-conductance mechanosensitive channel
MTFWHRLIIAAAVFAVFTLIARVIDWWLARKQLPPEAVTRYRVLRRGISASILVVGFFSALLVIPQVQAVAGAILASSAVFGVIIGFASQKTLGNFIAGLLIAVSQPVRLGDRVTYDGEDGVVEDVGLTYTFIRTRDDARLVVPNEKLVSDTIRNASIRSRGAFAEVTVQVPLSSDLRAVVADLREEVAGDSEASVLVTDLGANATVTIRARAADEVAAYRLESDLRVRAHGRLGALGVWA